MVMVSGLTNTSFASWPGKVPGKVAWKRSWNACPEKIQVPGKNHKNA